MSGRWNLIRKLFPSKSQRDSSDHDDTDNDAVIPLSSFYCEKFPPEKRELEYTIEFKEKLALFVLEDYNKLHHTKFEMRKSGGSQIGTITDGFGRDVCGYHIYIEGAGSNEGQTLFAEVFWCRETQEAKITICDIVEPDDHSARSCIFCPRRVAHPKGVKLIDFAKACCDRKFGGVVVAVS